MKSETAQAPRKLYDAVKDHDAAVVNKKEVAILFSTEEQAQRFFDALAELP